MGVIPLILFYLIKPLQKKEIYIKKSPNVCSNLQIMHHNICVFTKSTCCLSLMIKESPIDKHMIMRYPNYNFFSSQVLKHQCLLCCQIVDAHFQHFQLMGTTFEWGQVMEYFHQLHTHFQ